MILTWRWFRYVWRGHGGAMAWLLVGSALTALLYAAFAWSWKVIIDAAQGGELTRAALTCLAIGVGQGALYIGVQGTRTRVNERIQQAARRRVLAAVAAAEPGALAAWRTGDLVTRLTDDVSTEKLAWFLCSGVFRAYEALLIVVACVVGMVAIDPGLTLWSMAPLPLLVLSQLVAGRELGRRADDVQQAVSRVGEVVQDVFDGVRVVQARSSGAGGLGALARRAFATAAGAQVEAEVRNARLFHFHMVEFGYGWQITLAALLYAGGVRVIDGTLGMGDFVAFNGFVMTLVFPMFDFGSFIVRFRQASACLGRLQALAELPAAPAAPRVDAFALPAVLDTPHLRLDLGAPLVLRPGQLVAVTGPVGGGKSTLLAALAGQVRLVGGAPPLPAPAWVPQDPVILSVTVAENILLGGAAAGEGWPDLLDAACLTDEVGRWPDGVGTAVGERGVTLSGGQQQRVQLARALASNLPVLLLDDATSALDADTEARFWDRLDRAGRVVVVVTHRPATLARADVVLYLRAGRVEARGTHAALVATHAAYGVAYGDAREATPPPPRPTPGSPAPPPAP